MSSRTRRVTVGAGRLTLALALLGPAAAAHAAVVGLADQQAQSFADPRVRALGLRHARLTVPWDAATAEPQAVAAWLAAVQAAGMAPHVAFEHLATDRCPGQPCAAPTAGQYGAAIRRFVARFPQVRTYTAWNEANHASQPVADDPEARRAVLRNPACRMPGVHDRRRRRAGLRVLPALAAALPAGEHDHAAAVGAA